MPIFCKDDSKYKLVALTKGKNDNIYWYSILDKDNKPENIIINGMCKRFLEHLEKHPDKKTTINKIIIYDNKSGIEIGKLNI